MNSVSAEHSEVVNVFKMYAHINPSREHRWLEED